MESITGICLASFCLDARLCHLPGGGVAGLGSGINKPQEPSRSARAWRAAGLCGMVPLVFMML